MSKSKSNLLNPIQRSSYYSMVINTLAEINQSISFPPVRNG
jgi:hypothetical protein